MPAAVQDSPNKIFVGSMPKAWTEAKMESVFVKFGKITEVNLMKNKETGESRGFGFITFESSDDASNAIEGMKGKEIEGSTLKVDGALKSLHASNPGLRGRGGFRGGMGMGMRGGGPQGSFRGRGGPLMRGGPRGGFSGRGGPPPRGGFMPRGRGGPPSRGMGPGGEEMGRGGPPTRGMGRGAYEGASAGGTRGSPRGGMRGAPRGASRGAPRGGPPSSRGRGGVGRTLLDRTPQLDVEPEPRARPLLSKEPLMTGPGLPEHRPAREPRGRPVERERESYRDYQDYLSPGPDRWEDRRPAGPSYSERGLLPREPAAWDEPARREEPLLREREARAPPPLERHAERPRPSFPPEREAAYGSRSTSQYAEESYGRAGREEYPASRGAASYDYAEARPARSEFGAESYRRDPYAAGGSSDLHAARPTRDSLLERDFATSSRSADPYGPPAQSSLSRGYGAGREAALSRESMLPREPARGREAPPSREFGAAARGVPREYGEARREESLRGDYPSASRAGAYPEERPAASLSARYYDDYEKPAARGYGAESYGSARDLGG
ncbi:uncharacterized protein [Diadema antillarum]|uniref:uncharacterized protein n=1 Tax=Diadema antillarum TaxID=105358 RepID=UPI003A869151